MKHMKKQQVLAILLGGMLLEGCSSKPDVGDIDKGLKEFWKPCELVELSSIKKTNGLERGDAYQMAISYKLELTKDIEEVYTPGTTSFKYFESCHGNAGLSFTRFFLADKTLGDGVHLKKGEIREVETEYTMIKSEKGWIIK